MSERIFIVSAEFANREDAIALIELLQGLKIEAQLSQRQLNIAPHKYSETRLGKHLLRSMAAKPNKTWTLEELGVLCEEKEYLAKSAGPLISKLCEEGLVVRVARGNYRLVK